MKRIDLLIASVIVAAIIFSVIGVATYERLSPDTDYDITWQVQDQALQPLSDTRQGNGDITFDIPLSTQNLTSVDLEVVVAGSGPRANNVNAQIRIEPADADEETDSGSLAAGAGQSSFTREIAVVIRDAPNETEASGEDEDETLAALAAEHTSTAGTGTWRVIVTISGSQGVPVVGGETFTVTVTPTTHAYRAAIQPTTPDVDR